MRENANETARDQRIVVFALAIFICVFLGPFNTGADLDLWNRVSFWTIAITIVGLFMEACIKTAMDSRWLIRANLIVQLTIGSAIGSVPGTAIVVTLNEIYRPDHMNLIFFPKLWAQVTVMGVLIAGLDMLFARRLNNASNKIASNGENTEEEDAPSNLKPARLYQRLSTRLREAQIISMSMQDHYVEVTTSNGSEMILMRLSDAIDLLDDISGVQTHRSHWAAQSHAVELSKNARRHELTLSDGRSIPVSNSYKAAVIKMLDEKRQT